MYESSFQLFKPNQEERNMLAFFAGNEQIKILIFFSPNIIYFPVLEGGGLNTYTVFTSLKLSLKENGSKIKPLFLYIQLVQIK